MTADVTADVTPDVTADLAADVNVGAAVDEPRLGNLTLRQFLRRNWQRKPLLVRDALRLLPERRPPASDTPGPAWNPQTLVTTRTLFALARATGWLAHALETQAGGQLIRPRARYVGR